MFLLAPSNVQGIADIIANLASNLPAQLTAGACLVQLCVFEAHKARSCPCSRCQALVEANGLTPSCEVLSIGTFDAIFASVKRALLVWSMSM